MSPAAYEQVEIAALEFGLRIRELVEDAEAEGVPPTAIAAALIAQATIQYRNAHGAAQVAPWLEGIAALDRQMGGAPATIAQH